MIPTVAIVGRTNVGKSTLFNVLTRKRDSLVYNTSGVTRDRQYSQADFQDQTYLLIDTGGMSTIKEEMSLQINQQSIKALAEADLVYFMVDAKAGLTPEDINIRNILLKYSKKIVLIINKNDGLQENIASSEFYKLGLTIFSISAIHKRGISKLLKETLMPFWNTKTDIQCSSIDNKRKDVKFSIIGKPNVGKSTLVNNIFGDKRVITSNFSGTTIDSIYIPFIRNNSKYTMIDTAGVRRKSKIHNTLEKFSIVQTLKAVLDSDVTIVVIDSLEPISDQDLYLINFVLKAGKGIVIALNKWDKVPKHDKKIVKKNINDKLFFLIHYVKMHFISAINGSNIQYLFKSLKLAYDNTRKKISTNKIMQFLDIVTREHSLPISGKYRIKIKYAHMGGVCPPVVVFHGNQLNKLPLSYKKYLEKKFRMVFNFFGSPLIFEFKENNNPYKNSG